MPDLYKKEQKEDAYQWADDLRKRLLQKAKDNPTCWQAKFLKRYNGKVPVIHREHPRRITSFFEKTLDINEIERQLEKQLERW